MLPLFAVERSIFMVWEKTVFDGLEAWTINDGKWTMTAVSGCGPRIAFLGKEKNLLYWDTKPGGKRGEWKLRGGHRVWLSRPYADESEDTYLTDNEPCATEVQGAMLTLISPAHPVHKLERGIRIIARGGGHFTVTNFVHNIGDLIYSGGVWSPTCIEPAGKILRIPLGVEDATWDVVHVVIPRVFAGNHTVLEDPQVRFEGNDLTVRPTGRVVKRCAASPKGIVRMECPDGIVLQKKVRYVPGAAYPMNCNVAVFAGDNCWMGEIETFGIEQPIIPGQTIENIEEWELFE